MCALTIVRSHGWYTRWEENMYLYVVRGSGWGVRVNKNCGGKAKFSGIYQRSLSYTHIRSIPPPPHSCRMAACLHRTDSGKHDHGFLTKEYYILYIVPAVLCEYSSCTTYVNACVTYTLTVHTAHMCRRTWLSICRCRCCFWRERETGQCSTTNRVISKHLNRLTLYVHTSVRDCSGFSVLSYYLYWSLEFYPILIFLKNTGSSFEQLYYKFRLLVQKLPLYNF